MSLRRLIYLVALLTLWANSSVTPAHAQGFDSRTGVSGLTFTGSTPRSFMGQQFNLDPSLTGNVAVTRVTMFVVSATAQTYNNVQLGFTLWGDFNSAATGATPVFSNSLGTYTASTGPVTFAANTIYTYTITLGTPVALPKTTNLGIVFNYQGDVGAGLQITDNLTSALRTGTIATGSVAGSGNGYYRNQSGSTDYNFLSTDARILTGSTAANPSAIAFILYVAPESGTATLVVVGLLGFGGIALRRRFQRLASNT